MSQKVPEGWRETRLGPLTSKVGSGVTPRGGQEAYHKQGIPLIRSQNVLWGTLRLDDVVFIDKEQHERMSNTTVVPGDVLLNITGASIGRSCLVRHEVTEANVNQHVCIIRSSDELNASFLNQFLLSKLGQAQIDQLQAGGNRQGLNFQQIRSFILNLPPLSEQRRIAEILTSVDEAIAATQAVIDQTRTVKQGVMNHLLTKGIGHSRFKQTEIGEIPENWEVRKIDEIGSVRSGRQRSPHFLDGTPRPYLRVANVFDGYIDVSDVNTMNFTDDEFDRFRLVHGDILLNEGQSIELVGRNAIYIGNPPECCFQNTLILFRAGCDVIPAFAFTVMQHLFIQGRFMEIATRTTSVAHLGTKRFGSLLVPLPPLEEQAKIAEIHDEIIDALATAEKKLAVLIRAKKAVMSDLLTGRVRVAA